MQKQTKNILIIGDGIAAWCLMFELNRVGHKITQISHDESSPACSPRSTSINCLRGTTRGKSPLGDLICESYEYFEKFNLDFSPAGIYKGMEYQLFDNPEKWLRRYPEYFKVQDNDFLIEHTQKLPHYFPNHAYFIDPVELKNWFLDQCPCVSIMNERVIELKPVDSKRIISTSSGEYSFDQIYVCAGKDSLTLLEGLNSKVDYYLQHSKPVAGSYFEISLDEVEHEFENNLNLYFDKYSFIYRKDQNILQIGSSSTNKSDSYEIDENAMSIIYEHVKSHLKIDLPAREKFKIITGVRHKGFKRRPYWGEVAPNIFAVCGLYKNAYTFAFLAANNLVAKKLVT